MKPTRLHLIAFIIYGLIAFASGYATAINHVRQCEAQNKLLANDLARAVAKGVEVQTHLILCEEQKGAKK